MSYAVKRIRLLVPANKAKPSPSIGQSLGSVGINMMKFCKDFNAQSTAYVDDLPLRVRLHILNDGSYSLHLSLPHSSFYVKRMLGVDTLGHTPGHETVGTVHCKQVYELAKLLHKGGGTLALTPLRSVYKSVLASCKSFGVDVSFEREQDRATRIAEEAAAKAKDTVKERRVSGKKKKKP